MIAIILFIKLNYLSSPYQTKTFSASGFSLLCHLFASLKKVIKILLKLKQLKVLIHHGTSILKF